MILGIADWITGSRIVFSLFMLSTPVHSLWFFIFYLLSGVTDIIDGPVARKMGTCSEFGARLDTVADILFALQKTRSDHLEIKLVDNNNFTRDSLKDFQRYQEVKNVYRLKDGEMTLVYHPFTEDWDDASRLQKAEDILSGRYVTYGAFEKDSVVGEIMLIPELDKGRLIIESFHVSTDYRRRGIGRALFEAARQEAIKRGAHSLYASCCSSEETIKFYSAMGFCLSSGPIPARVEDEPYDLQMVCMIWLPIFCPNNARTIQECHDRIGYQLMKGTNYYGMD